MDELEHELYVKLQYRYSGMVKGTDSETRINEMMQKVVDNHDTWPKDKTGRWVGYVQCILIEVLGVTTVNVERDFTRPLFHALYKAQGYAIPKSVEIAII